MGIGLTTLFILPLPISFAVALLILFLLNAVRIDIALRRQGVGGIRGLYKSMSSFAGSSNNNSIFGGGGGFGYSPIKFYCMNCGY
jgi:hypothetical protein